MISQLDDDNLKIYIKQVCLTATIFEIPILEEMLLKRLKITRLTLSFRIRFYIMRINKMRIDEEGHFCY